LATSLPSAPAPTIRTLELAIDLRSSQLIRLDRSNESSSMEPTLSGFSMTVER
jgi:hypothetical protein